MVKINQVAKFFLLRARRLIILKKFRKEMGILKKINRKFKK